MVCIITINWIVDGDIRMSVEILNYSIPNNYIYVVIGIIIIQIGLGLRYMSTKKKVGRPKKTEKEIYICTTCGAVCSTVDRLIEHNLYVHNLNLSKKDAKLKTEILTVDEYKDLQQSEKELDEKQMVEAKNTNDRIEAELVRPPETEPKELISEEEIAKESPETVFETTMNKLGEPKVAIPLNGFCDISFVDDFIDVSAQFKVMNTPENWEILARIGKLKRV